MANNPLNNNNNWLGFSLSPQEELISGDSTCFDHLTPPPPSAHFSLLQPAGNNVTHSNPHPDWKMINPAEDSSAPPKLENFLGQNSFNSDDNTNGGGGTMGLSMIKHWLRNNPTPPENSLPKAQALSLSMSRTSTELGKPKKSVETFGQRTSIYRGVTRHRWTGRYEAHLWDNTCRREGQTRKGRQVYLGGYDKEDKAARSYDLAALKYWGTTTTTNFPMSNYEKEIDDMKRMTRQEYVASLRRKSSGFSRGASIYRGVTRHHQHGRWQARIGRVAGNKDLYLGTFTTQEEAAEAYDIAAIKFRGLSAVTNFEINRYDVKSILDSTALPIGGAAKRLKDAENDQIALQMQRANEANTFLNLQLLTDHHDDTWQSTIAFQQQPQPLTSVDNYHFALQKPIWCKQEQDTSPEVGYNFLQPSNNNDSFGIPTVDLIHQENNNVGYNYDDEGVFGSADGMRNLYYHQFQQQSMMNDMMSWNHIPTAVPTVALERTGGLAPTFAGWNDS